MIEVSIYNKLKELTMSKMPRYMMCPECGQRIKYNLDKDSKDTLFIIECINCEASVQCVIGENRTTKILEVVTI
jgi:transcription elongation factor Elf1